ncbi:TonB-dependent receptor [Hellea balneolensis]|uniref:TonB-dependent receptor n=1 Tax=Hellea balneolensis TaxID=287478 RepID=UPI000424A003|nr:TonB-dependent receptor [Hellea balneolensis]
MAITTNTSTFLKLLLGSAIGLVTAVNASAQSQSQDEIVVTGKYLYVDQINALKSPTPIIDVPQSLSIVTADQITNQGFDSVGDIINYIPGVTNTQGEGHRDAVVFRGVRSTADFFVDGVRDDVQYYRGLYNIEQVEILRGANALLFGRGGTGGLVNRVTKKGQLGEQFTGYKASLDTFGAFGLELDSNFATSDNSAIRINGMYENLNNHRDFYDGDRFAINPTARFELSPQTIVDLSYEYIDNQRFIDRGIPVNDLTGGDGEPVKAFKDIVFGDPELNTAQNKAHVLRATLTQEFSNNLKGVFNASYSDFDKLYQNFYAQDLRSLTADGTSGVVRLDGYVDTTQRKSFNLSGNLIGEFATGRIEHTIVTGLEYRDTSNNNDRFNPEFPFGADGAGDDREDFIIARPLNFFGGSGVDSDGNAFTVGFGNVNDNTEADVKVFSAFIQDEIALSDKLDIVIGARFDSFDFEVDDLKTSEQRGRKDEEISPRLGLVLKPQENVSFYGSFSQSFLPRSGGQFASVSNTTQLFEPDVFESLEAGLKWDIVSGLSFTAAYFQNEQTIDAAIDGAPEDLERRGLEVDGFELQLEGQFTERLYVRAGYANLKGKTDFNDIGVAQELPRELPENTFSIWSNFQVTDRFGLGLGATYQDEAFISDLDIGAPSSSHPTLPSFTRLDAAAYYDVNDDMRIQVNIENLTDTVYFPSSHSTHQATVGAPLNARFTVSGRF